ncbi:hypothetical protein ASZ78_004685 [Callipepla squamata]|uniref:BRCA1-associated ATM activator 1 n=1 Tax=Callipepla squamata TaxID=9009 RepID=A0A226NJM0_CALSU|nr:hypothetical protein ASZ78_004685 [Callipepla squamata]
MDCILRAASQPLEYAGLLDESVSDPSAVESLLSSKSSCASLLCQTLAHLEELLSVVTFREEKSLETKLAFLPMNLPYASLLRSVVTILQFCNGLLIPATPLGSKISQILVGCFRVQRSALDALAALSDQKCCDTVVRSLLDVLLAYLESPNTTPTVLKKSFKAMSKWLMSLPGMSFFKNQQQTEKILQAPQSLQQLCWQLPCMTQITVCIGNKFMLGENKASLLRIAVSFTDHDEFRQSLLSSEVPKLAENLLDDPESYVRASAVTAVGHLAFITFFLVPESPVAGSQYNKEKTVAKLQEILSTDPEGFPRRAVMSTFTLWLKEGCTGQLEETEQFVSGVVQTTARDLDWEVKLGCLELVQIFCNHVFCRFGLPECPYAPVSSAVTGSMHQNEPLQIFCRANLFSFLFGSLCDCDKPVGQKACDILLALKSHFCQGSTVDSQGTGDVSAGCGIQWLQRTLRQGSLVQNFPTDDGNGVDFQDPESMMVALRTIDLVELHNDLNKCSDYVERSPQSLLEDILATAGTAEENEADCY